MTWGWNWRLKEEFQALGCPGKTGLEGLECIEVMKTLWCDDVSSYQGKYFSIDAAYQNPKPVQKPHIPILFGGRVILHC